MTTKELQPLHQANNGRNNLTDYQDSLSGFSWKEVEKQFSWHQTGRVNMAYECIDRHVGDGYGEKSGAPLPGWRE